LGAEAPAPYGIFFKPDGTRMFLADVTDDTIIEYDLSTPWQVNTATYNGAGRRLYVGAEEAKPRAIVFRPDGTRMFIVGESGDAVVEYNLSTPWQVNTATWNGATREFYVGAEDSIPNGLSFKPDGSRMFIIGFGSDTIIEYDLSTPWQVNTATWNGGAREFYVGAEEASPYDLFFRPDGTRMFIVGQSGGAVVEYDLSTPWQVNTATWNGGAREFYVGAEAPSPYGVFFKPDGTRMFILEHPAVVEYDLV
jgi:DNA-binding beta-propeller fold protein YncE